MFSRSRIYSIIYQGLTFFASFFNLPATARIQGFTVLLIMLAGTVLADQLPPPSFSHPSGFYKEEFNLLLSSGKPGATIYYTLDGSEPDPDNLEGSTFRYRNRWPEQPGQSSGSFFTGRYITYEYAGPLRVHDRSKDANSVSRKSSAYYYSPWYFPSSPVPKAFIIRARVFIEGYTPSPTVTRTYFINPGGRTWKDLPVISIQTAEKQLFDYDDGIYTPGVDFEEWREENPNLPPNGGRPANYHRRGVEWEYPAHFSFWDEGSAYPDLAQDIGFRIHGGWSRSFPMKSIRIYARSEYGESSLDYTFFRESDDEGFKRLILRNSGNDWFELMFRDAFIQGVNIHLRMDTQAYRPAVLFLNGEYWGIHNIRERYDKHYLERVYGVEEEMLDLLTLNGQVKEGDDLHYSETLDYIKMFGVEHDHHYRHIQTRIDTENFIDYQIANIYAVNTDWPGNNIDYWRKRTASYEPASRYGHDGRWRWLAFDMDFGFALHSHYSHNTLEFATQAGNHGWPNPDWSTFLLREMLKNDDFKRDFVSRFADLLNSAYLPGRVGELITAYQQEIEAEMGEHIMRWSVPSSVGGWNNLVNDMRNFANERPRRQWDHLMDFFSLPDTGYVRVDVSDPAQGYIRLNSLDINEKTPGIGKEVYPWSGTYFEGVPVRLEAVPYGDFTFSHWEVNGKNQVAGNKQDNGKVIHSDPAGRSTYTAHFLPEGEREVVHYWHFNSLTDSGPLEMVLSDFSRITNGYIIYRGSGEGYMDMVNDGSVLNLEFGQPPGYALRVRNPSHERELVIHAPTTGFDNLFLEYAVRRTPNGAGKQSIYVSADAGESWTRLEPSGFLFQSDAEMASKGDLPDKELIGEDYIIEEEWQLIRFDLSAMESLSDNEHVRFRILFGGENIYGDSGNNRFDNISLKGERISEETLYYSKSEGHLHEPSTWGINPDGSGDSPPSFEKDAAVYVLTNRDSVELSANWAITGEGSCLVAGDGQRELSFSIPPDYIFAGTMDVSDGAKLFLGNPILPDIQLISPGSVIVFEQTDIVTVPPGVYGSLWFENNVKRVSGSYTVLNDFKVKDAAVLLSEYTLLSIMGDVLYTGEVETLAAGNLNMLINGEGDQWIVSEGDNMVEAYNLYIEKKAGHLELASDIFALNNFRVELGPGASFSDGGRQIRLNDDLRLRGDGGSFDLTGSIFLTAGTGTNDFEVSPVALNELVIDVDGDARPDFALADETVSIRGDFTIRSRSERPVRLRDRVFHIGGDLHVDISTSEQIEEDRSILVFSGSGRQRIANHSYDGPGMLQNITVDNPEDVEVTGGNITFDGFLHFERGLLHSSHESMLKLGPGYDISGYESGGGYVNGPLGIYDRGEGRRMDFAIGDQEGLKAVFLSLEREDGNIQLFTAEYFRSAPPGFPLSQDVAELIGGAGYFEISHPTGDVSITGGRIRVPYLGYEEFEGELCIALLSDDEWISIGAYYPEESPGYIESDLGFDRLGLFALARATETLDAAGPEGDSGELKVYPNPAVTGGEVILEASGEVYMYSIMGEMLIKSLGGERVSLEGLEPGVYLLRDREGNSARLVVM